ncbi:hypothetical protein RUM44_004730 [Polyplax serrata]|uniref:Uncharacterized protein n=1 Tax=Polyplax serrata TaxID=468196 RepID=A0ABR1B5I4_POLSC
MGRFREHKKQEMTLLLIDVFNLNLTKPERENHNPCWETSMMMGLDLSCTVEFSSKSPQRGSVQGIQGNQQENWCAECAAAEEWLPWELYALIHLSLGGKAKKAPAFEALCPWLNLNFRFFVYN